MSPQVNEFSWMKMFFKFNFFYLLVFLSTSFIFISKSFNFNLIPVSNKNFLFFI